MEVARACDGRLLIDFMSLFIDCLCVVHEDLWERRTWIGRAFLLPAWIAFPFFYLLAVIASKGVKRDENR